METINLNNDNLASKSNTRVQEILNLIKEKEFKLGSVKNIKEHDKITQEITDLYSEKRKLES